MLAIARPDLSVLLVEPLARRAVFLAEVVTALDLGDSVTVLRARAEELAGSWRSGGRGSGRRGSAGDRSGGAAPSGLPTGPETADQADRFQPADLDTLPVEWSGPAQVVTARAVAPLDRLAGWCLPLAVPGGRVLALKGATAGAEVAQHATAVRRLGGSPPEVRLCGVGVVEPPTTVVEFARERVVGVAGEASSRRGPDRRGGTSTGRGSGSRR